MNAFVDGSKNDPNDPSSYFIYNLQNSLTKTFNLTKNINYYFIIEASLLMVAKINISLPSALSKNYVTVKEIQNKDYIFNHNYYETFTLYKYFNDKNIKYNLHNITHMIEYPTSKYLLLNFIPKNNISNFSISVDLKGKFYTLSNNFSINFDNLEYDNLYYFILEPKGEYISANISFKTNSSIYFIPCYEILHNFTSISSKTSYLENNKQNNDIISSLFLFKITY